MSLYSLVRSTGFRFSFVAEKAGMKPARFSEILHGSARPPRLHERIALAQALTELAGLDEQTVREAIDAVI